MKHIEGVTKPMPASSDCIVTIMVTLGHVQLTLTSAGDKGAWTANFGGSDTFGFNFHIDSTC